MWDTQGAIATCPAHDPCHRGPAQGLPTYHLLLHAKQGFQRLVPSLLPSAEVTGGGITSCLATNVSTRGDILVDTHPEGP